MIDEIIKDYILKYSREKDSLIVEFIKSTGAKAEDVCLVERQTYTGRVFYPDFKSNLVINER